MAMKAIITKPFDLLGFLRSLFRYQLNSQVSSTLIKNGDLS
jgi:hypothetical protein